MKKHAVIGFIGGGNMARSLIGGLIQDGYPAGYIRVCDPDPAQRERLQGLYGLTVEPAADRIIAESDSIVLAVKPQSMREVITDIRRLRGQRNPLFVSIAAGIRLTTLERWLQQKSAIVRCMPNTPALIRTGATVLCANAHVDKEQRNSAETLLRSVGLALWIEDENLLDAVTAVSGSGPAYIFAVIEAMQAAAESLGLSPEHSRLLCLQTAFGAAKMALEDSEPVGMLRQRVTSKGGTTEKALGVFAQGNLPELFRQAITAACERSQQLAQELDRD
jgi:pyrroline-5-carboxylate reductase